MQYSENVQIFVKNYIKLLYKQYEEIWLFIIHAHDLMYFNINYVCCNHSDDAKIVNLHIFT